MHLCTSCSQGLPLPHPLVTLQVYYPVPNEVYRDEWEDVQVTDPMEFTHCRYTPVVTEVRRSYTHLRLLLFQGRGRSTGCNPSGAQPAAVCAFVSRPMNASGAAARRGLLPR